MPEAAASEDRRALVAGLGALTALVAGGLSGRAFAGAAGQAVADWVRRIDALAAMLRAETVSVADWRAGLETLFGQVALADLLRDIEFERLAAAIGYADRGVAAARIDFGGDGVRRLRFVPKLFAIDRGRAIVPHGHAGMVSAHLALQGRLRLRQYDQLRRDPAALYVRPTRDIAIGAGDLSSIGLADDNVHWFVAEAPSHTFDVIVTGLEDRRGYEIFNLDMAAAKDVGDGVLRAPVIGVEEALAKYG